MIISSEIIDNNKTGIIVIENNEEKFEYYNLHIFNGKLMFNIRMPDVELFDKLYKFSVMDFKFDVILSDYKLFVGCIIQEVACYSNARDYFRITIIYDYYKNRTKVTKNEMVIHERIVVPCGKKGNPFIESEDAILYNAIMKELDLWLTDFNKYCDMKEKGLIKYV
jgi:hypothetical protein